MKKWMLALKERKKRFMLGRYGNDELSLTMSRGGLLLLILSLLPPLRFLLALAFLLAALSCARSLSRNLEARQTELTHYLKAEDRVLQSPRLLRSKWRDRRTHRYYRCPVCKTVVRIRRPARGVRIKVRCPNCGCSFEKRE